MKSGYHGTGTRKRIHGAGGAEVMARITKLLDSPKIHDLCI